MPNTAAVSTSFKQDLLNGIHAFGPTVVRTVTTPDIFYGALYLTSGNLSAATPAYTSTSEVSSSGTGYTAGGAQITNTIAPTTSGTTAYWTPSLALTWPTVTLSVYFDTVLIYNHSAAGLNAVANFNFGAQVVSGSFSITMPTNNSTSALIRLS